MKLLKNFKFKHRFVTTLLSLIMVCFLLCCFAYYFLINMVITKSRENSVQMNQSYINTEADNTNQLIYQLHQSLTQLSYSRSILNMVFYTEYKDSNKNLAASDLALTVQNNLLIDSAILYLPEQQKVITSSHCVYPLQDYSEYSMIADYDNHAVNAVAYEDTEKISSLFFYSGDFIMARDFPLNGPGRLGPLFYKVNINEIYSRLTREIKSSSHIWVYDTYNLPVFAHIVAYPDFITRNVITAMESSGESYRMIKNSALFYSTSKLLGWKFIYEVDESALTPGGNALNLMLVPIIIMITAAILFIFLFITSGIYLPKQLGRLLKLTDGFNTPPDMEEEGLSQNEFEHLNQAFSRMAGQQTELKTTIDDISPDILSRLFLDLLSGVQKSQEDTKKALTLAHSSFEVNAFYMAGVLYCDGDLKQIESRRHYIQKELSALMDVYNQGHHSCSHILTADSRTFVIILSFALTESLLYVIKEVSELESVIHTLSKNQEMGMRFQIGHIYYSILDIGFSYRNALDALPPQETGTLNTVSCDMVSPDAFSPDAFSPDTVSVSPDERAEQILNLVMNQDIDNAYVLASRIITQVRESQNSLEQQREQYKSLMASLSKRISRLEYVDLSVIPNELLVFEDKMYKDADELAQQINTALNRTIDELHKMLKKQQNHFIIAAQDYISTNYSNPDLSLNFVAEAINVNPSYLSKLFKSSLGINFTEYISDYRVKCSMALLKETTMTLNDISVSSGFNSVQNYIRVFKKYAGMTPGQYRKN